MPKIRYIWPGNFIYRINNRWESIRFTEKNKFTVNVDWKTLYKIIRDKDKGLYIRLAQDPESKKRPWWLAHRPSLLKKEEKEKETVIHAKMWTKVWSIWTQKILWLTKQMAIDSWYSREELVNSWTAVPISEEEKEKYKEEKLGWEEKVKLQWNKKTELLTNKKDNKKPKEEKKWNKKNNNKVIGNAWSWISLKDVLNK